jgi:NADPH:quinone reductase-like Zn-dependent oxidoreductase
VQDTEEAARLFFFSGYKLMKMMPDFLGQRPYIPEHDFSGVVVDSNDSKEYSNGDQVYGWIRLGRLSLSHGLEVS